MQATWRDVKGPFVAKLACDGLRATAEDWWQNKNKQQGNKVLQQYGSIWEDGHKECSNEALRIPAARTPELPTARVGWAKTCSMSVFLAGLGWRWR